MPFNVGDIAVVKTTGEKVIVLSSLTYPNQVAASVSVRRAIATKDMGLAHVENVFFEFELETFEDQLTREFNDAKLIDEIRSKLVTEVKALGAGSSAPTSNKIPFIN